MKTFNVINNVKWILAAFIVLNLVQSGTSLRCWQCSSDMSPECGDPMNNTEHHKLFHTKDCESTLSQYPYSHEKMVCRKTVQRAHGQRLVIRSCAVQNPDEMDRTEGKCSPTTTASHITVESCDFCSSDLCNGSSAITGYSLFSLLLFTIFACYLNYPEV